MQYFLLESFPRSILPQFGHRLGCAFGFACVRQYATLHASEQNKRLFLPGLRTSGCPHRRQTTQSSCRSSKGDLSSSLSLRQKDFTVFTDRLRIAPILLYPSPMARSLRISCCCSCVITMLLPQDFKQSSKSCPTPSRRDSRRDRKSVV